LAFYQIKTRSCQDLCPSPILRFAEIDQPLRA
jgi:hypothetical protein